MSAASIKPRHRRFMAITLGVAVLAAATGLVLSAFQKNLVFFFTPSQVLAGEAPRERSFRIGGLVEAGSLRREPDGMTVHFTVSDTARRVAVVYRGALPDLFQEGKGVVAQGRLGPQGPAHFIAEQVLAKHDENYMPPEASHAISAARRAALEGGAVRAP